MAAYVESIWAFKSYLIENIDGEQANLIAQILTADNHLTQDDLALIESMCAEDKTEILLDILLNKKDKVWCDVLLDLLEGIGLNHLAKAVKGIESPGYISQNKASTSKMMQHQATVAKPVDQHVNDNQIRASTSKVMQDEIGIAEPVDHDITMPKLIQLNICDVAEDTDDENSVSTHSESEPCSSNNLSLNSEAGSGTDIKLRNYQKELADPGIAGQNCVIVAPTGTGKTHVAVHICKEHLKSGPEKKVVFLVPKVPLVQQQHETFRKHLDAEVKLTPVSGGGDASIPVGQLLRTSQVIIMTHQLLLNVLLINEFNMEDISLLIFDECHHTMKGHPYKQIMDHYMKLKNIHVFGSNKLPQIVGLTASPGSGKSSKREQALEYIMKLLGNLDVTIAPVQVVKHKDELAKYDCAGNFDTISVPRLASDRFSETINGIMEEIEKAVKQMLMRSENVVKGNVPFDVPSRRGTQYEQVVVEFNKQSLLLEDKELSQKLHICAIHLRTYNDALLVNDHVRPSDARDYIEKTLFEDQSIGNDNKRLLKNLYDDSGATRLATDHPSPLLQRLIRILREHFAAQPNSRCIVFARTREIARSLVVCINEDQSIGCLSLNPEFLTGSGAKGSLGGLTKVEQDDRLKRFSDGICKLMIATTVAEEGIDIQACNLVLTYNHTTNEIAQVQRKGRGRARGSKMYVLAYEDSNSIAKGNMNTARDELTQRCLRELREMHPGELAQQIRSIQVQQRCTASVKEQAKKKKSDDEWQFLCKSCRRDVTTSKHFRRIKQAHHVVVDQDFPVRMVTRRTAPQSLSDDEMRVGAVLCGDKTCRQPWGMKMLFKDAPVYVLKIKNFVLVNTATNERILRSQWKKAPFEVKALDNEELVSLAGMIDNDSDLDPLDVTVPSDSDDNLVDFSWDSE